MSRGDVRTVSHAGFIRDFAENVGNATSARLFAMQLEVTPQDDDESSLVIALNSLLRARSDGVDARLALDLRYTQSTTRVNNRDFPNWWPLISKEERGIRRENASITGRWLKKLDDAGGIENVSPRRQPSAHATLARVAASGHIAQHWAVVHQKGGVLIGKSPETSLSAITTGNLTTSDIENMNNLAVQFTGARGHCMGQFITRLISPEEHLRSAGGHIWRESEDDWVTLIHDYNNVGDPARLPFIHLAAEKLIDPSRDEVVIDGEFSVPKPEVIVYTSQYPADGKLALMLKRAHHNGVNVIVPRQPEGDYRQAAFPYNVQDTLSRIHKNHSGMYQPARERPSHVKSLLVKYSNNTASILFGSDNYLTHVQKVVRNEEIAVLMKINPNSHEQLTAYGLYLDEMLRCGEIDSGAHRSLRLSR